MPALPKRHGEQRHRRYDREHQRWRQYARAHSYARSGPYAAARPGSGSAPTPSAPSQSVDGGSVVSRAYSKLGCAYSWGGIGPDSFDCSGFVSYCLTGRYCRLGTTGTFMGWTACPTRNQAMSWLTPTILASISEMVR